MEGYKRQDNSDQIRSPISAEKNQRKTEKEERNEEEVKSCTNSIIF